MERGGSSSDESSRSARNRAGRQLTEDERRERERRRREWRRQQELERMHEELRKRKIEEYERKRKAEAEKRLRHDTGRSSGRSNHTGRSRSSSPRKNPGDGSQPGTSRNSVMSEICQSSEDNTRLFQGPEGTKIDLAQLRHIKVAIHRKVSAAVTSAELRRDIPDPEDVKVKRREGEGSKPIFDREELKKFVPEVVEERRTVVSVNERDTESSSSVRREEKRSARKRSGSPTSLSERPSTSRRIDDRDSRYESSRRNVEARSDHGSHKRASETDRSRSGDKSAHEVDDKRGRNRASPRRRSRDASRERRDRRRTSHSAERESRRSETRNRSERESLPRRDHRERSRDDSRDRRNRDGPSRERRIPLVPHPYAEAMPVPLYYETYPQRPIMIGPMMPIAGQIPMGRGGIRPIMGPMRPPYPPRFFPPEMYRPNLHPNPRFSRMF